MSSAGAGADRDLALRSPRAGPPAGQVPDVAQLLTARLGNTAGERQSDSTALDHPAHFTTVDPVAMAGFTDLLEERLGDLAPGHSRHSMDDPDDEAGTRAARR